ncbi:metallophosphoesterase [Pelomonas sp. V22]|uniref:metallophosphoesterase n=1 Tax=Pelomonas sp. V22 TaxID=2822139 RepID=UPI0024A8B6F6|nr:metallophosphoesterase [Pelomonas sp. V22]MDI4634568.1 metallophosphoesterase [Pelomonas sp. V22]
MLGAPSNTSIHVNLLSPDQSGQVWISYGKEPGQYSAQTAVQSLRAGQPLDLLIGSLAPDTRYYYRTNFQRLGNTTALADAEYSFQTARPAGSSFSFAVQGDSHPERLKSQFDPDLYTRTLLTVAADRPDFYVMLGDDFSVDTLDPATINAGAVTERYTLQRPFLGLLGRQAPIYLVNGNHEQAAAYLLNGTPDNVAVWAQNARNAHYAQPAPDDFYSGNSTPVPFIGLLRNYYAWQWGDALFVVIDPYWHSPVAVDNVFGGVTKRDNMWDLTHGDAQYRWLKATLEGSKARYKFVFAHHVMGTGRGGTELARLWEWGGENSKGVSEFAAQRPTWNEPLHALMARTKVSIFFQGHDHIWVRQQLDGVTYQTVSEPADPNYSLFNSDAFLSGDKFPNSGYTRVSVTPTGVKVEYVRTFLPKDEGPGRVHGGTAC